LPVGDLSSLSSIYVLMVQRWVAFFGLDNATNYVDPTNLLNIIGFDRYSYFLKKADLAAKKEPVVDQPVLEEPVVDQPVVEEPVVELLQNVVEVQQQQMNHNYAFHHHHHIDGLFMFLLKKLIALIISL
jgi:hypothetical protein